MTELTERDLLARQLDAVRHNHGPDHPDAVRLEQELRRGERHEKIPSWWDRMRRMF